MRISDWSSDVCSSDLDRILGGDPLNGLIVQVFSEVLRRAHPRDQLASACVVQVLVQRLHRDTLTNLARVEAIPAATDEIGRESVGKECVSTCSTRWSPYN